MDRDFFLNAGPHFEPSSQMPSWKLMSLVPEMNSQSQMPSWKIMSLVPEMNSQSQSQSQSQVERFHNFDSVLTSMVPSPVSNSPQPKNNWPIIDHLVKENTPMLRNSIPLGPGLPSLAADPGFAERAAKFSCFGSRSFNSRTSQLGLNSNNPDLQFRSSVSPLIGNAKLPRVSGSPLLKNDGSAMRIQENKKLTMTHIENGPVYDNNKANSNEESSVSEQMDIGPNSKKRKGASLKGKAKETSPLVVKEEGNDDLGSKKTDEDGNDETEKKLKVPEPPKDYIHVRARRGQATDSHSLAERVRREKISERMKLLQDLVPGCNKVTGKALMLDEIINYVQSLQHQVEFLSMKLATVNPRQDCDMNSQLSKDISQSNGNLCQQLYQPTTESDFYEQNPQQQQQQQQLLFIGSPVDPLNPVHGATQTFAQFAGFEGDELHSIVKMGFREIRNQ